MYRRRGSLVSPNHPNNYPDDTNCTWTIGVHYGRSIQVNFTAFSIRGSAGSCTDDYVEVETSLCR